MICPQALVGEKDSSGSIEEAFRRAWHERGLFCESVCHENVTSLFLALKKEIPGLDPKDFKVLFITHPKRGGFFETGFEVHDTRENTGRAPLSWGYHVVLEYEGRIFDLSRAQPMVYEKSEYLNGFIVRSFVDFAFLKRSGKVSDLVVHAISGEVYLRPDFRYNLRTMGQIDQLLNNHTPTKLVSYMNE